MSTEKPKYRELTREEEEVIVNKGTEVPFTGKYFAFWNAEPTFADGAAHPFIFPRQNSMRVAAGQASTTRSLVQ